MRKIIALCLALLLCGAALAEVRTTGSVNLRSGPGLDYESLTTIPEGTSLYFYDEISTDERGVDWYNVYYDAGECDGWVSSKYAELVDEYIPRQFDLTGLADFTEVSGYYLENLDDVAAALGLTDYRELNSEVPRQFYSDALTVAGNSMAECFVLTGGGYTLFGAAPGMTLEEARQRLEAAGLVRFSDYTYEHPGDERSMVIVEGMDSCVNLWTRGDIVQELDWSSYTG